MLDKKGVIHSTSVGSTALNVCVDCHCLLSSNKLPHFALADSLYHGHLPEYFQDLTWVEEMVCSIYHNTAHVTQLYDLSDSSQPRLCHGNTCAHDMNIVSTMLVLPQTPADIKGMLSVVFVGTQKLKPEQLKSMFTIRKDKVFAMVEITQPLIC